MYDRDPQLRCKGEQIEYTREMIQEYLKCKEDILYFAEKYFKIISFKGEHCIELREYQRRMLKAMTVKDDKGRRHVCMVAARQIGKCLANDMIIKIRNKKTGEIHEVKIGDFFDTVAKLPQSHNLHI